MYMCVRERERERGDSVSVHRDMTNRWVGSDVRETPDYYATTFSHVFPESAKWSIKSQMTSTQHMQSSATPSASNSSDHCTAHYQ